MAEARFSRPPILYISYDGMMEPLGESQVLGYLRPLAADHRITLLSFEKPADLARKAAREQLARSLAAIGIAWHPLRYHKAPTAPATAWDIAQGTAAALRLALRHRPAILHARSYVAGLMALGVKRLLGIPFLFDMRGLWVDERVDGGLWPRGGRLERGARRAERSLLVGADAIVTLTHASVPVLRALPGLAGRHTSIHVIPTCADLELFSPAPAPPPVPLTLGYLGSVGTWYLFDETLRLFQAVRARRPEARLLVVNRGQHDEIRRSLAANDVPAEAVELTAASRDALPPLVARMHVGLALIKPARSKVASAPTKLAEYLGCGVPCVGNEGCGDMADLIRAERVGVVPEGFAPEQLDRAATAIVDAAADADLRARCVGAARRHFSLESGVAAYRAVYRDFAAAAT